jgi:uncharacterized protein (TIGR03000 family)
MFGKAFSFGGLLLLAGVLVLVTPGSGQAQRLGGGFRGGFHGGGFHGGGFGGGFRGFRGGFGGGFQGFRGGLHYAYPHYGHWGYHGYHYPRYYGSYGTWPYYNYGYYPYYGYYPNYSGYYPYGYGNYPYYGYYPNYSGYNPYGYGNYSYDGYYPNYSGYYPYDYGYSPYSGAYFNDSSWYPNAGGSTSVSPLPSTAVLPQVSGNNAAIHVRVPFAVAEVTFNGQKITTTGIHRIFTTPELTPGKTYTYVVTANWTDGGLPWSETRTVQVQAGQVASVDLTKKRPDR